LNGNCELINLSETNIHGAPPPLTVATSVAPNALNTTNVTSTRFTGRWNSESGAAGYRLNVPTNSSFTTYVPAAAKLSTTKIGKLK
jgi:hypothetical protein